MTLFEMKKISSKAQIELTGFLELVTDFLYHIKIGMGRGGIDQHKHARASIIASALSVESCANCLLNSVELSSKTSGEIERLPTLTKIDVCIQLAYGDKMKIDRSDNKVAKIQELIGIRNDFVHPKRQSMEAEWGVDPENPEGYKIDFEYTEMPHTQLKIPKNGLHWNIDHAKSVAVATLEFFDYIFRQILKLDSGEVYHIVGSRTFANLAEEGSQMIASGPVDEYEDIFRWASQNGLAVKFLQKTN